MFGEEYTDTVTIGGLVIEKQSFGSAQFSMGLQEFDGILGYEFNHTGCPLIH